MIFYSAGYEQTLLHLQNRWVITKNGENEELVNDVIFAKNDACDPHSIHGSWLPVLQKKCEGKMSQDYYDEVKTKFVEHEKQTPETVCQKECKDIITITTDYSNTGSADVSTSVCETATSS